MQEKCESLLHGTIKLDKAMLDLMSGPMLSEAYCCFVIIMVSLNIIKLPDRLPERYRDKRHCFETGIPHLRWCHLFSEMGSDPELFVSSRACHEAKKVTRNIGPMFFC